MASPWPISTSNQPSTPERDRPAPGGGLSNAPKIALPKNLAQTLQFLRDDDLETLRDSVKAELERRHPVGAGSIEGKASGVPHATAAKLDSGTAIPAGRASLIKASYRAGMKPVAIARTLRVPLSIVNKVLSTESKVRRATAKSVKKSAK